MIACKCAQLSFRVASPFFGTTRCCKKHSEGLDSTRLGTRPGLASKLPRPPPSGTMIVKLIYAGSTQSMVVFGEALKLTLSPVARREEHEGLGI